MIVHDVFVYDDEDRWLPGQVVLDSPDEVQCESCATCVRSWVKTWVEGGPPIMEDAVAFYQCLACALSDDQASIIDLDIAEQLRVI